MGWRNNGKRLKLKPKSMEERPGELCRGGEAQVVLVSTGCVMKLVLLMLEKLANQSHLQLWEGPAALGVKKNCWRVSIPQEANGKPKEKPSPFFVYSIGSQLWQQNIEPTDKLEMCPTESQPQHHIIKSKRVNLKLSDHVVVVQSLSYVWLFETPWTAACQASLSITNSQSLLKFMSIVSVMLSNYLISCHPFLLLPSVFPSIRVFSSEFGSSRQVAKVLELRLQH